MTETIQAVLAPLSAFWVVMEGVMKASNFVNIMRDTIISGVQSGTQLTLHHRKAIFVDWCLSMLGFVISNLLLSGVIFSFAKLVPSVATGIYGVFLITFLGAILFIICGISDYKAIKHVLSAR